jgi:2-polyprenyl-3-methyl-5-hydroxy-6-metoxy-1,4-benzoquinol methylase
MVTIDLNELNLKPHDVVLDAGCGLGRHLRHLARMPELKIFGIDKNTWALTETAKSVAAMPDAQSKDYLFSIADITKLPFADSSFDCVICSEVMEHIPDHEKALKELDRILKPQGTLAVSVPRFFTERICWFISWEYHNEEGGHIRIYKKKQLREMLTRQGFKCWKINYKHALHSPYWWLKCLVGLKKEDHPLVKYYRKFLEWDIMKKPRFVRMLEDFLNPIMGKSIVYYLKKG